MKKLLAIVLAVISALTILLLAGCGGGSYTKDDYIVLDEALADEKYGIGFRKEDQALRDEVQKYLVEMKKDGKLAEITKKWFGEDTSIVPDSFTPAESSDNSLQKIKQAGVLKLGLDDSFPPMGYQNDDGEIVGYDIDLAKEVCKRMGVELKLVPIDWNSKEMELNAGNIDCIWNGMTITPERQQAMNMSEPYFNNRQVVVTLKEKNITKLTDLKDKKVVLQNGSTAVDAINDPKNAEIKASLKSLDKVDNNVSAMYELRNGISDAVILDEVVARYYISHMAEMEKEATTTAASTTAAN